MEAADKAISRTHELMESIGLTRPYYLTKLKDLCEATKPISCVRGKEKDADGGTVDFIDVPDNRVQLDAVKEVIALFGDRAPEKKQVSLDASLMSLVAAQLAGEKDG